MPMKHLKGCQIVLVSVLVALTLASISGCQHRPSTLSQGQKLEDFEFVFDVMRENYPLFGVAERQHGIEWLSNYERYKADVANTENDIDFAIAIQTMLADLRDGHTQLLTPHEYERLADILAELSRIHKGETGSEIRRLNDVMLDPQVRESYDRWRAFSRAPVGDANGDANSDPFQSLGFDELIAERVAYLRISSFVEEDDNGLLLDYLHRAKDYQFS